MNTFHTSLQVVKRGAELLCQHVLVGGESKKVEFTKEVLWLQGSESDLLFMHGGKDIKKLTTRNDFYGYLSSCEMDDEILGILKHYKIDQSSTIELVIRATVFLSPAIETAETIANNLRKPETYKSEYAYIPDDWRKESLSDDGKPYWPTLNREELLTRVVWSSKNSAEQNNKLLSDFREESKLPASQPSLAETVL